MVKRPTRRTRSRALESFPCCPVGFISKFHAILRRVIPHALQPEAEPPEAVSIGAAYKIDLVEFRKLLTAAERRVRQSEAAVRGTSDMSR